MKYLIWSKEHNAWWVQSRCGYTTNRKEAGRFPLQEAVKICKDANSWTGDWEEVMVPDQWT